MEEWVQRAKAVLPAGVTHDIRWAQRPKPYFSHGLGGLKWDLDGMEYIDFVQGHGALLLGIADPVVTEAIQQAVTRGTHLGGNHPREIEWAERIVELVPCAERVRFTSSGTEASMLALRLARAAAGRDTVMRLHGHFHGWHDAVTVGLEPPYDIPVSPGVPASAVQDVVSVEQDLEIIHSRLAQGDVAALICEPSGPQWGTAELTHDDLREFRRLCDQTGTLLIFDEVITGFRAGPGGMQEAAGVTPDLCVLGKIMAGGMPGGAVAGPAGLFAPLEMYPDDARRQRYDHTYHPGTFNANPVSAAAGCATLQAVRDDGATQVASEIGAALRGALTDAMTDVDVPVCVYGQASWFHVLPGHEHPPMTSMEWRSGPFAHLIAVGERMLLDRGVDNLRMGGMVGTAHTPEQLERSVPAFVDVVRCLVEQEVG